MQYPIEKINDQIIIYYEENKKKLDDSIDVEFEESTILVADKYDYIMAASSGMLTAGLDIFWRGTFSLEKAHNEGKLSVNKFVISVAKFHGYKGKTLNGAIKHLEDNFKIPADSLRDYFGGARQHHLRDLSHHCSIIGLIFSILSQFTTEGYGSDTDGFFIHTKFESNENLGVDIAKKITLGTITWAFHIVSDMAGSSGGMGEGTGIPGPLLSFLKTLALNKNINEFFKKHNDVSLSKLVSKMFNGTYFKRDDEIKGISFDFRTELGIAEELSKQKVPLIINECIIRSFYFVRRFIETLETNKGKINKNEYKNILPYNNRIISRMALVSVATFNGITVANSAIMAKLKNPNDNKKFVKDFVLSINYIGIVRLAIALKTDAKYLKEDFHNAYKEFEIYINTKQKQLQVVRLDSFKLTNNQNRILISLEKNCIDFDIANYEENKPAKQTWRSEWIALIKKSLNVDDAFFIDSEKEITKAIERENINSNNSSWMNIIDIEMSLFRAYYPLGNDNDKLFRKLKYKNDYLSNKYLSINLNTNKKTLDKIVKCYKKNENYLKGANKKAIGTLAATATISVATAGFAWAFAPSIAVWLTGGTFTGLYGAALTNASLALLGGGSLAAGGLGMAGGTAVVTGGGAFLGAISTYGITQASLMAMSSKQFALKELTKVITYADIYLSREEINKLVDIQLQIEDNIYFYDAYYKYLKVDNIDDKKQKDVLNSIKATLKYLKLCDKKLSKMVDTK